MQNSIEVFGSATARRRLLLLAYYFPPRPKGGAPRLGHVAKSLAEFGWEVTVVTPSEYPDEFRTRANVRSEATSTWSRRMSRELISRLKKVPALKSITLALLKALALPRALLQFPDRTIWWLVPALRDVGRLHKHTRFDAILTSCSPGASHVIGAIAARWYRIPWIADYQDLWSQSAMGTKSERRRNAEQRLETWALRQTSAITCCKDSFVPKLQTFTNDEKPMHVVPMAVDMGIWDDVPDLDPCEFRLAFVGNMYAGQITPDLLFAALMALRETNDPAGCEATFHYYGHCGSIVRAAAKRYGLEDVVFDHGVVPRRSALAAERAAALLVAIVNADVRVPRRKLWQPSKLFEYAGARRHILGIAPPHGVVEDFLRDSGLGYFASDQTSIAAALQAAYALFLKRQFRPSPQPSWRYVTPRDLGRVFDTVLNAIVAPAEASAPADPAMLRASGLLPSRHAAPATPYAKERS